jgi:hypothetical protein
MPGKPQSLQIDIPSIEGIHKTVAREARDMRERRDAGCGVPETSDLESSSVPPVLPAITQNPGDRLRFEDRSLRSEATASNRGPPTSLPHASDIQPPTLVLPLRTQNSKLLCLPCSAILLDRIIFDSDWICFITAKKLQLRGMASTPRRQLHHP